MNKRDTLHLDLGVFADFTPRLDDAARRAPYVFLGTIDPRMQRDVVAQLHRHGLTHVPIVLMTADTAAAAQLPRAEFPEYLLKPF